MEVKCTLCNGSGIIQEYKIEPSIYGQNKILTYKEWEDSLIYFDVECPKCEGSLKIEVEYYDIPDYGHVMTMEEFINACESGAFINYDGDGNYATKEKCTNVYIKPSDVIKKQHLTEFTHVVWYNR